MSSDNGNATKSTSYRVAEHCDNNIMSNQNENQTSEVNCDILKNPTIECSQTHSILPESNTNINNCLSRMSGRFTPRLRVLVTICLWEFFLGVERSVVLPSLWLYLLNSFSESAADAYYGGTLAAFNVAVFIFSPIFGLLSGYCKIPVKMLLIVSNVFEIIGNVLYFVAWEPWIVLIGRLIAGIGGGSEVPLYSDIVRCTNSEERTGIIIMVLATRHLGIIIGPAFTLIVSKAALDIGTRHFTVYNFPGLLMAILWVLHTTFAFFIYPKINHVVHVVSHNEDAHNGPNLVLNFNDEDPNMTNSTAEYEGENYDINNFNETSDLAPILTDDTDTTLHKVCCSSNIKFKTKNFIKHHCNIKNYLNVEIMTMLITVFGLYISVMGLEAVLPPVAQRYFNWTEVQISYVYLGCGGFILVGYVILRFISKCLTDRTMLGMGILILIIAYSGLSIVLIFIASENVTLYATLIVILVVVHVIGIQFCITTTESLFSKISPVEDAERAQSIFRTVVNASFLVGPYLGGELHLTPYLVMIVMSSLMMISGIFFLFAFPKLNPKPQAIANNAIADNT